MATDASRAALIGCLVVLMTHGAHPYMVVVNTDKGKVQGKTHHVHGKRISVFYGIPYARPPVGDLRFMYPEQIDPWNNTRDATTLPNACMQVPDKFFGNFSGSMLWNPNTNISEDCLYLNVWAPHNRQRNSPKSHKAVFVWVHGGGFNSGSAVLDVYDGKYLTAEHDVVVVSMQFRVGSLGYFYLGAPLSPGNAGMMDLRMSLEWIQKNIHRFGGSPYNVTLVGESSGAASVGLFMLSSLGRGLFHRAILQSAGPQLRWVTQSPEESRRRSLLLAERLGCRTDLGDQEIVKCLRDIPADRFPAEESDVSKGKSFIPVIDGAFLTKEPDEYLRGGEFKKVPILLGANTHEGSWLLVYRQSDHFNLETESLISPETYNSLVADHFQYYPQYPRELNHFGLDAVRFQYTNWSDPDDQSKRRDALIQAAGDLAFTCGVVNLAQVASSHDQDVYVYRFNHRMSTSPWPSWMGVLHGDEIFFVFGRPLVKSKGYSILERKLSRKMMKMWTNFAKTGNPNKGPGEMDTVQWPKYKPNEQSYLDIDLDLVRNSNDDKIPSSSVRHGFESHRCAFWDNYLPKLASVGNSQLFANCSRVSASTSLAVTSNGTISVLLSLFMTSQAVLSFYATSS